MLKKIYAFKNSAEAGLMVSLLKENKFHPLEVQVSDHLSFAGADMWFYVQIPEEEYLSASKFLLKRGYKDIMGE